MATKKKNVVKKEKKSKVLVLRTCNADMTSHNGFKWPKKGPVKCSDWDPKPECGNGLHGLLWGEGDGSLLNWDPEAKWLVVEAHEKDIVEICNKVKFPSGVVVFCGDQLGATSYLQEHGAKGHTIVGAKVTGGDRATVTGGDRATVTGGDRAKVTGGYGAKVTGGDGAKVTGGAYATVTGGYGATVTGGYGATVTGGYGATVIGGDRATVTGGHGATVTGGHGATVTGGNDATVTGGNDATVTGGYGATVTGGDGAMLSLKWYDGKRYRLATFYVGEKGIKPNVAYKCEKGKAVKVSKKGVAPSI